MTNTILTNAEINALCEGDNNFDLHGDFLPLVVNPYDESLEDMRVTDEMYLDEYFGEVA